jgi:hypothetical protein
LKPEDRATNFMQFYKKSQVHYEPLGVVAAIVSWNYSMRIFHPPDLLNLLIFLMQPFITLGRRSWRLYFLVTGSF